MRVVIIKFYFISVSLAMRLSEGESGKYFSLKFYKSTIQSSLSISNRLLINIRPTMNDVDYKI